MIWTSFIQNFLPDIGILKLNIKLSQLAFVPHKPASIFIICCTLNPQLRLEFGHFHKKFPDIFGV